MDFHEASVNLLTCRWVLTATSQGDALLLRQRLAEFALLFCTIVNRRSSSYENAMKTLKVLLLIINHPHVVRGGQTVFLSALLRSPGQVICCLQLYTI